MPDESPDLPPHIEAALRAPEGTTVEDIYARFPEAKPKQEPGAEQPSDEFKARYEDAKVEWHQAHGWSASIPREDLKRLADQVRSDMKWERDG